MNVIPAKPFLKWAGGKSQLVGPITDTFPKDFSTKITNYVEPFVGRGAILFEVLSTYRNLKSAYISDINGELINAYRMIRERVEDILPFLQRYEATFLPLPDGERRSYYYEKRMQFNELIKSGESKEGVISAALFIFLNRTCFNGLYRANRSGLFNVPMGVYRHPSICSADNLRAVSHILQNVEIVCADYRESIDHIDKNTFVYFDPPYRSLKEHDSFNGYNEKEFDDECQRELAEFLDEVDKTGARFILSNSDPKNTDPDDNFFDELYSKYHVDRIQALRIINRNADSRGGISELLVRNYDETIN